MPIDRKYIIKESKTLDDYVLTEETKIVELKQNEVIEVGFTNEKKKGQVEIVKTSNKDNKITEKINNSSYCYDQNIMASCKCVSNKNYY